MSKLTFFIIFLCLLKVISAANILAILGISYYSHQMVHHHLMKELLQRGHNLTIFGSYLMDYDGHENVTQYKFAKIYDLADHGADLLSQKRKSINSVLIWLYYERIFRTKEAETQMSLPELQDLYINPQNRHFDLIIMECNLCPFAVLADIYKCPIIHTLSSQMSGQYNRLIGNYVHPAIHAETFLATTRDGEFNIIERIDSMNRAFQLTTFAYLLHAENDSLLKKFFPKLKFRSNKEVMQEKVLLFYNFLTSMTTSVRPVVPIYKQIGFMQVKPPKELAKDSKIKKFLDSSKKGVILVSFGSIVKNFDEELFTKFANTFKLTEYDVLWKASKETFPHIKLSRNVMTADWIPILDVLAHPNLKLMIGHSGTRTIEEAIDRLIPMVLFPLGYDQHFNAYLHTNQGIATILDLNEFTETELVAAINETMNKKYKKNIEIIRAYVKDQIMNSVEIAAENIDYLIKHNESSQFQLYEAHNINFFAQYSFDIHLIIVIFVTFVALAVRSVYRIFCKLII